MELGELQDLVNEIENLKKRSMEIRHNDVLTVLIREKMKNISCRSGVLTVYVYLRNVARSL